MKKIYSLLLFIFVLISSALSAQDVVINEVDADTPGSDTAEFIELKAAPNTSLDGYLIVFFSGSSDLSYGTWDLTDFTTDANGFFILGNNASTVDIELPPGGTGYVQNGADAIAIYFDAAANFPDGTAPTTNNLVDAIVYGTGDADDSDLLTALGETAQWDESANDANAIESLQLNATGTAYETKAPTFRAENNSAVCALSLTATSTACNTFTAGTDTYTATLDFSGGGTSTYTVTSNFGTVDLSMGNPTTDATGTITITNISEGTDVSITVSDDDLCDLSTVIASPSCNALLNLPFTETFTYANGSLLGNGNWENHSGTEGDILVDSGRAIVQLNGASSEDINLPFTPVTGSVFFGFDMTVQDPGNPISGTDNEYFAHFKDDSVGFFGRVDIVEPSGSGDFTLGISTSTSAAQATWATDLVYGTTYRITVKYDQIENIAALWINANSETDTSISGVDGPNNEETIFSFALRQSASANGETVLIDNLRITQTFDATLTNSSFTAKNVNLYPNPTFNGFVTVKTANPKDISVSVFDILGKKVISRSLNTNRLDVSALNPGVYILRLSQQKASVTKKLIIK